MSDPGEDDSSTWLRLSFLSFFFGCRDRMQCSALLEICQLHNSLPGRNISSYVGTATNLLPSTANDGGVHVHQWTGGRISDYTQRAVRCGLAFKNVLVALTVVRHCAAYGTRVVESYT